MVVSDYGDADLFENPEGLEALIAEPTTESSKRSRKGEGVEKEDEEANVERGCDVDREVD